MSSMRRVRKNFRKDVLRLINSGDGDIETLMKLADDFFGDVGNRLIWRTFRGSEVGHAVSYLRNEGIVESIGKLWKPAGELTSNDVGIISTRRMKRVRGELTREIKLAHDHGLTEEAVLVSKMLDTMSSRLPALEPETETADVS